MRKSTIEIILSQGSNFEPIKGEIAQLQVGSADEIAVNANEFLHRMALCLFFSAGLLTIGAKRGAVDI